MQTIIIRKTEIDSRHRKSNQTEWSPEKKNEQNKWSNEFDGNIKYMNRIKEVDCDCTKPRSKPTTRNYDQVNKLEKD